MQKILSKLLQLVIRRYVLARFFTADQVSRRAPQRLLPKKEMPTKSAIATWNVRVEETTRRFLMRSIVESLILEVLLELLCPVQLTHFYTQLTRGNHRRAGCRNRVPTSSPSVHHGSRGIAQGCRAKDEDEPKRS